MYTYMYTLSLFIYIYIYTYMYTNVYVVQYVGFSNEGLGPGSRAPLPCLQAPQPPTARPGGLVVAEFI